jgi:mono/diheme cytochrome c family protein
MRPDNEPRRLRLLIRALAGLGLAFAALPAWPQQPAPQNTLIVEMGAQTYRVYCASCHGLKGLGDGPVADYLRFTPPDLRKLAQRNRGKFDFEKVYRLIDGREAIQGHGGADMPVWGDAFLEVREGYSPEKVKERITQLVRYLESIQEPGGH